HEFHRVHLLYRQGPWSKKERNNKSARPRRRITIERARGSRRLVRAGRSRNSRSTRGRPGAAIETDSASRSNATRRQRLRSVKSTTRSNKIRQRLWIIQAVLRRQALRR